MYAIVDPNDTGSILYLTESEYKSYWKVALSNSTLLAVLARPGETQPDDSVVTAPKPNTPRSPSFYFRKARVYSRVAKALWGQLWTGGTIVPTGGNISILFRLWGNTLRLWTGLRVSSGSLSTDATMGIKFLQRIYHHNGPKGLVLYLKHSLLILNKFLAGTPVKNPWELPLAVSVTGGLPTWFPLAARHAIRQGSHPVIRVWTSICYTYKAYNCGGFPSVKTILTPSLPMEPANVTLLSDFKAQLPGILSQVIPGGSVPLAELKQLCLKAEAPPLSTSSGPNGPAMKTAEVDAWLLARSGSYDGVYLSLRNFLSGLYGGTLFPTIVLDACEQLAELATSPSPSPRPLSLVRPENLCVSRVSFLQEAAGKVRNIGILDYFSQWALRPLHLYLANLLQRIGEDGTFDQSVAVTTYNFLTKGMEGTHHSLDLSAATDSIPYQLYVILLNALFGEPRGELTLSLMRGRPFSLVKSRVGFPTIKGVSPDPRVLEQHKPGVPGGDPPPRLPDGVFGGALPTSALRFVRNWSKKVLRSNQSLPDLVYYTRGQPMGSYGSFPLLALVHHCIIQFCALRVGLVREGEWFGHYRILGDDIVFLDANGSLCKSYMDFCAQLSIPISLGKSFQSSRMFNFASRTFFKGTEVSPAPLGGEIAVTSVSRRVELALSLIERGWGQGDMTQSSKNWMSALVRVLSNPLQFWFYHKLRIQEGRLNAITTRLLASALIPSSRVTLAFDLKAPPVSAWVSSLRADIRVIDSYESISIGEYKIATPMYRIWLLGINANLWARLASVVAGSILSVHEFSQRLVGQFMHGANEDEEWPSAGYPTGDQTLLHLRELSLSEKFKRVSWARLDELFDGQSFAAFLQPETRTALEKIKRLYLIEEQLDFLEGLMFRLANIRDFGKFTTITIDQRVRMVEQGVIALLDSIRSYPVLPEHYRPDFFDRQCVKPPWFFVLSEGSMEVLHGLIIGLTSKVYNYSPEDPTGEASLEEIPVESPQSQKEGEFSAMGAGELFKL